MTRQRNIKLVSKNITARAACLAFLLVVSGSAWLGSGAEPTPPEMIPPDVTVPGPGAPDTIPSASAGSAATSAGSRAGAGNGSTFFTPTGWPFTRTTGVAPSAGQPAGAFPYQVQPEAPAGQQASLPAGKDPLAVIQTSKGTIVIRLFRKFAPLTVAHFMEIAGTGFYNGLTFHRVVPGRLIEGGCPNGNGSGFYTDPVSKQPKFIALETSPNLKHNAPGVVGLTRIGRSAFSSSCQFYITLSAQPGFDGLYSIFGGVISGMDTVRQIQPKDRILSIRIEEQR